jgi:hypothetical protein
LVYDYDDKIDILGFVYSKHDILHHLVPRIDYEVHNKLVEVEVHEVEVDDIVVDDN